MTSISNLFVCCTPLQGLLARRLIAERQLDPQDCAIFFYTSIDNHKYRLAYERVREVCADGLYYVWRPNFPRYVFDALRFFRAHDVGACYFASIDSVFVQLALSTGRRKDIFTFDDGTANIVPSSNYYLDRFPLRRKRIAFWLLGNRYSLRRIKREIRAHYTIYPDQPNISPHCVPLDLFPPHPAAAGAQERCIVVIGTVLRELFAPERVPTIAQGLVRYIDGAEGKVFYIPHPRELEVSAGKAEVIHTPMVAEEVLMELMGQYRAIELAGFGSSTQVNLAASERIANYFFTAPDEPAWFGEVRQLEARLSGRPVRTIPLG